MPIEIGRPEPPTPLPLQYFEPSTRLHWFRRQEKKNRLYTKLDRLHWDACHGVKGAAYRYFNWLWTFQHPRREWPYWWADQSLKLAWLHHKMGRPYPWTEKQWEGSPLDPIVEQQAGAVLLSIFNAPAADDSPFDETPQAGEYVVDVNDLYGDSSDSGDGLVGGTAWLTESKMLSELAAGTINSNKIWIRGGANPFTTPSADINLLLDSGVSNVDIRGWPGETTNARWDVNDTTFDAKALLINGASTQNITVKHLEISCGATWAESRTSGNEFVDLPKYVTSGNGAGGDNAAPIKQQAGDILVELFHTIEVRPVGGGNQAEDYGINSPAGTIKRNGIYIKTWSTGVSSQCIYFKRNPNTSTQGDVTYRNIYCEMRTGQNRGTMHMNGAQYFDYINLLVVNADTGFLLFDDNAPDSGPVEGYSNRHLHITAHGLGSARNNSYRMGRDTNTGIAGTLNVVKDSCFGNAHLAISPNAASYTHDTDLDYCNHRTGGSVRLAEETGSVYTTQSGWEGTTAEFLGDAHDGNSVYDDSPFAGTPASADLDTWAVKSALQTAASDGTQIGADPAIIKAAFQLSSWFDNVS